MSCTKEGGYCEKVLISTTVPIPKPLSSLQYEPMQETQEPVYFVPVTQGWYLNFSKGQRYCKIISDNQLQVMGGAVSGPPGCQILLDIPPHHPLYS